MEDNKQNENRSVFYNSTMEQKWCVEHNTFI